MKPVALGDVYHDTVHHIKWTVVGIDATNDLAMIEGGRTPSAISMIDLANNLTHRVFVPCSASHYNCRCSMPSANELPSYPITRYESSSPFALRPQPVCECGAEKARTTHSYWCPLHS